MNDRSYDTKEYRAALNKGKRDRRVKDPKRYTDYEDMIGSQYTVYVKSPAGLTNVCQVSGTRAKQVAARREARANLKVGADMIVLFSASGKLLKAAISM